MTSHKPTLFRFSLRLATTRQRGQSGVHVLFCSILIDSSCSPGRDDGLTGLELCWLSFCIYSW
ncbi:hypothetical protein ACRRTK_020022 [Alexandromys fortis]